MICGFIEQQKGWLNKKRSGEGNPHSPASRKWVGGPVLHALGESETSQQSPSPGLSRVGSNGLQLFVHFLQSVLAVQVGLSLQLCALVHQLRSFHVGKEDCVDGGFFISLHFLFTVENINVGWNVEGTSGKMAQKSCLAVTKNTRNL